jgi:hypothetical protein
MVDGFKPCDMKTLNRKGFLQQKLLGGDWNMAFIFRYIGNFIIPTELTNSIIFQRGRYTTKQETMIFQGYSSSK